VVSALVSAPVVSPDAGLGDVDGSVVVVPNAQNSGPLTLGRPESRVVAAAAWAPVAGHIVAATLPDVRSRAQRLSLYDVDSAGLWAPLVDVDATSNWLFSSDGFSPDGTWLLMAADDEGTGQPPYETYVIDVATGDARLSPIPIFEGEGRLQWFDGSTLAKAIDRTLYALDLPTLTLTARGTVPTDDVAYSPVVPGS